MAHVEWSVRCVIARVVILLAAVALSHSVDAQAVGEYQLKAVFLYNFAQFVDWPKSENRDAPFVIGILGDDPFDRALDETVRGEHVGNRSLAVKRFDNVSEVSDCQILFVSASKERELQKVFAALKGKPILTVSDVPEFARRGGMIQFVMDGRRVKFLIDVDAARAANLTLSSKLLHSATIVSTEGS